MHNSDTEFLELCEAVARSTSPNLSTGFIDMPHADAERLLRLASDFGTATGLLNRRPQCPTLSAHPDAWMKLIAEAKRQLAGTPASTRTGS
jgi:hypothetical protein